MNNKDRKIFWDTLCSLQGVNLVQEGQTLRQTIKVPKHLYRFRPVTINSLESLRTNTIYFSTADYYDDPFDSYSYIDWDMVKNQIQSEYDDVLKLQKTAALIQNSFGIPSENVVSLIKSVPSKEWIDYSTLILKDVRDEIQKKQLSICFTEQCNNEVLWEAE